MDEKPQVPETPSFVRSFHDVLRFKDQQLLKKFVLEPTANPNKVRELAPTERAAFLRRALAAEHLTRENLQLGLGLRFGEPVAEGQSGTARHLGKEVLDADAQAVPYERVKGVALQPWVREHRQSRSRTIFLDERAQTLIASMPSGARTNFNMKLHRIIEHGIRFRYVLDNGILYDRGHRIVSLIQVREYPTIGWDPVKPLRAAAFGGWAFVPAQFFSVERQVERYRRFEKMSEEPLPQKEVKDSEGSDDDWEDMGE